MIVRSVSSRVTGKRLANSTRMRSLVQSERPRSPCSTPPIQVEILHVQRLVEPQLAPQRLDRVGVGIALEHLDDDIPRAQVHKQEDQES